MTTPQPVVVDAGKFALTGSLILIGSIAKNSNARQLLLSHFMPRAERNLQHQRSTVQRAYGGPALLAEDLLCIELGSQ